jgi:hypothetical protein
VGKFALRIAAVVFVLTNFVDAAIPDDNSVFLRSSVLINTIKRQDNDLKSRSIDDFVNYVVNSHGTFPIFHRKGGIGRLDGGLYIVLDKKANSIIFDDGDKWNGNSRFEPELVMIDKDMHVSKGNESDVRYVIVFAPSNVFFVDMEKLDLGKYARLED